VFKVNTAPITATTGLQYFLGFPTAQGTENLQSINVGGVATFYSNIILDGSGDYIQFPDGSQQTTASGGGAGGDVFLAGTQTFTGVNTFNNAGGIIMSNSPATATTTSIFQFTDNNCHIASSVLGGGVRISDTSVGATLAVNSNGLTINKGLQLGNTSGSNIVQMVADATTNNQLNITGAVNVSNTQSYPQANSQLLSTISYVNDAISGLTNLLTTNNIWSGTNEFNTSTPTTTITQTYPQTSNTTDLATIGYVNSAIGTPPTIITITSTNSATNDWTFTIPSSNGNYFSYIIYTDNTPTTYAKNNAGNPPLNFGTLTSNNSSFLGSGTGIYQPVSMNSGTLITYCSGNSQPYSIGGGGYGYVLSLVNSNGGILSWSYSSTSITENTFPCPPVSSGSINYTYTLNSTTDVPSPCNVIMKLTIIQ
jgi:hypothetical protein